MARRRSASKRVVLPDPVFGEEMVTKFISCIMMHGKRASAEKVFYGAIEMIDSKGPQNFGASSAVEVFHLAVENVKPMLEVKSRRVGGSNYQVPIEVAPRRRQALSHRWLKEFARKRPGRSMKEKLAAELIDACQKRGGAYKRREDVHKMADANRAFAHYRW
ncbi:MAG: 30S ribosomal protein S7 [Oligoflexales bacterium]